MHCIAKTTETRRKNNNKMGAGLSQPLSGVVRRVLTVWLVGVPKGVLLQAQPDQLRQLLRVEGVRHWRHRHEPLR